MVQFVFTPWRDRRELLMVRRQFYSQHFSGASQDASVSFPSSSSAASLAPRRNTPADPDRRQDRDQDPNPHPHRHPRCGGGSRGDSGEVIPPTGGTTVSAPAPTPPSHAPAAQHDRYRALVNKPAGHEHIPVQAPHDAVARVSMWMQRGNCPHLVESTALLMAATLSDSTPAASSSSSAQASLSYAVRVAYSAAFSRFVTGLLDSHQDKQRKMSMYDVARSVGLPATFVELRHQATHEQLPSLMRLRAAAQQALDWIWNYYWRHLAGVGAPDGGGPPASGDGELPADANLGDAAGGACRDLVMRYLQWQSGRQRTHSPDHPEVDLAAAAAAAAGREDLVDQIRGQDEAVLLAVLASVGDSSPPDAGMLRRVLELERMVVMRGDIDQSPSEVEVDGEKDLDAIRTALNSSWGHIRGLEVELEKKAGEQEDAMTGIEVAENELPSWSLYDEDTWVPKPIGVV